jgi:bifunctional aspartokinase / homoserine dehydrogenase 1
MNVLKDKVLVMKFGGTSLGTPEAMSQAVQNVKQAHEQWPQVVVVVSALSGVTDMLIESARCAAEGDQQCFYRASHELRERHEKMVHQLVPDLARQIQVKQDINHLITDFTHFCQAIAVLGEATPRAMDVVASLGERLSVRLMAAALESAELPAQFVEGSQLIITDDQYTAARPDIQATKKRTVRTLKPILDQKRVPVVAGFIASTPEGVLTTLGRGGSDYSAALIGVALEASEVWIWTDVDGVMTADPRMVEDAQTIPELSYNEVAELAYFGAKVLHPKTIHPIIEAGIGLRVLNTFNPTHPGTRIVSSHPQMENGPIKAVAAFRGLQLVTVQGRGMLGVPGVAARIFTAVATTGTSVPLIAEAASEQSICFAVPMEITPRAIAALEKALATELALGDIDRVWSTGEVAIVSVLSPGTRSTPGISAQIFTVLGEDQINVEAISYGSSEISLSLVVSASEIQRALKSLHRLIKMPGTES